MRRTNREHYRAATVTQPLAILVYQRHGRGYQRDSTGKDSQKMSRTYMVIGRLWLRAVCHHQRYSSSLWRWTQQAVLWPGENETTPLPVPGKRMLATFPCKEKKTNSEESGDCVLLRRLLHLQNARNGRGWEVGRMHKCLRWYHTDKCLNISQESLGLPWLFVLGTFHPFLYHAFDFYPCMHYLTFHPFLYHALVFIHSLVCHLYVIHALLAHLHCLILAPSLFA